LCDASANQQATTRTTLEKEVYLTEVMTTARVSRRSDLDTGEVGDGRSDATMDVAMEMAMAATSIAVECAGRTIAEVMERNEKGMQRRRSEAIVTPFAPSEWRSLMERMM